MTPPAPTSIGRLHRTRLLHPVRFFAYGWALLLAAALVTVGAVTGEWPGPVLGVFALLLMVPGIEAAARSAWSPTDVAQLVREARK